MRTYLLAVAIIIVFSLGIDLTLAYFLKKYNISLKSQKSKTFFWSIPIMLLTPFVVFYFLIDQPFVTEQWYWYFTLLNGLYILVYIPKTLSCLTLIFLNVYFHFNKKEIRKSNGKKLTRAQFLGATASLAALIPFSSLLYGLSKGRFNFKVHKAEIRVKQLPESLKGLTIVQLSDIHLGNFNFRYHQLESVVDKINALSPDLIVITGDLVNNFASETKGWNKVFSRLNAKLGKYAVLGNHDYGDYSDWESPSLKQQNFEGIKAAYHNFGFELINNTQITLHKNGVNFSLLGVENWGHPPFPQYGNLKQAMKGKLEPFKILLSHDPDHWNAEVLHHTDINLSLAGHTHGMQLGVKFKNKEWSPAKWKYKYWGGLYKNGEQYLYVNRGLGVIGIPFRIGMPPEITLLSIV